MRMLPKTHSTTEDECGEKCSFFFGTCNTPHLTCFDKLSRKKIATLCSDVKWAFYFAIYCFQRWSRGHKARGQGQGHKKNPRPRPRPRTAFPRTDTLEAKDRNARGQGQGPRTQSASALQKKKKKVFTKIFQAIFKKKKKRSSQKFFKRSPRKNAFQKFNRSTKF